MTSLEQILEESITIDLIRIIISNPKNKDGIVKVKIRPITIKGELVFQCESFTKTQAFQKNIQKTDTVLQILQWVEEFKQIQIETTQSLHTVLISKKGKITIQSKKQQQQKERVEVTHNRKKQYILEEGIPVPFLLELGVMTKEGKIVKSKFDKFRQINRFLEFIEDVVPKLPKNRELTIIDFGCGKSYLTFAMYYYLHVLRKLDVRIIGLDLKKEVITHCAALSEAYGYEKLTFLQGDIADYSGVESVDMVVTLHACNTATDIALDRAVKWGAEVILSVPCCQHELNQQIQNETLEPILKYGLIKERIASLVTDGLRAAYLEGQGYEVQVLEFIDMDHTPKNILIRGIKLNTPLKDNREKIEDCKKLLHVDPMLGRLLG